MYVHFLLSNRFVTQQVHEYNKDKQIGKKRFLILNENKKTSFQNIVREKRILKYKT